MIKLEPALLSDRAKKLRKVSSNESMRIMANLIDDLVLTYFESLKEKYPDASFKELILFGHKEAHIDIRRREFND